MKNYAMRLGKSPFDYDNAYQTLYKNTIGGNSGNLIYGLSAHKLFSTRDSVIHASHYRTDIKYADEINEKYDGFILPLANAFRSNAKQDLQNLTKFIRQLRVPFMVLSVGVQADKNANFEHLDNIKNEVTDFCRAVLDKSPKISVRGNITADYLKQLGFNQVKVIGCPSLGFYGGKNPKIQKNNLDLNSIIAFNAEPKKDTGINLILDAYNNYNSFYIPQNRADLATILWHADVYKNINTSDLFKIESELYKQDRIKYFLDAWTWIREMRSFNFCFGPRMHGNIAALLAGVPACVLVHDSRTLELCQYHNIPYIMHDRLDKFANVRDLYDYIDFNKFNKSISTNFKRLSDFVHECGFKHIFDGFGNRSANDYSKKLSTINYPPPQGVAWAGLTRDQRDALEVTYEQNEKFNKIIKRLQLKHRQLQNILNKYTN